MRYDHGEEEWTSISMVRVQRPIAAVDPSTVTGPVNMPAKQHVDLGEPVKDSNWRIGDRVLARWLDFYWYPGTILGMGERGVHILYDNGEQHIVPEIAIIALTVEEGSASIFAPRMSRRRWHTEATVTLDGESSTSISAPDSEQ